MGFVLEPEGNIGGEAAEVAFTIFERSGSKYHDILELMWEDLEPLIRMAKKLQYYHKRKGCDKEE